MLNNGRRIAKCIIMLQGLQVAANCTARWGDAISIWRPGEGTVRFVLDTVFFYLSPEGGLMDTKLFGSPASMTRVLFQSLFYIL